jgi:mRNA-degrading endonuclease RelE of RelBE toxin-antitoxin system
LQERTRLINNYKKLYELIYRANNLEIINTNEINNIANFIERLMELNPLKETLVYLDSELAKHDLSQIESLQKRIDLIDEDTATLEEEKNALFEERGKLNTQINTLLNDRIPEVEAVCKERLEKINQEFDVFFVNDVAEPAFKELEEKGMSPIDINTEYRVKFGHAQYLVNNVFTQLVKLRREYTLDYRLTYDTNSTDNVIYDDELNDLKEVKLPEYEVKIHDAYQKAVKQFKDDFISKLRNAIETVEDQIIELNDALSASTFGNDSYYFTVNPSAVYRKYYDMIKDDLLLEVTDNDSAFFEKYDDVMKDLFAQIVLSSKSGDQNAAVLANVERFTDYRNYLDFDLIVKDKTGQTQRLSKMLKKKSGGETQTPFYIAVLASFSRCGGKAIS